MRIKGGADYGEAIGDLASSNAQDAIGIPLTDMAHNELLHRTWLAAGDEVEDRIKELLGRISNANKRRTRALGGSSG